MQVWEIKKSILKNISVLSGVHQNEILTNFEKKLKNFRCLVAYQMQAWEVKKN